ncbi:hypothetical protein JCM14469_06080 [Desulfatiferula olefinivorans]
MRDAVKDLIVHFEHREETAYRERETADYDLAIGSMIEEVRMLPRADEQAVILSALALSALGRGEALSSEGLSRIAETFLDLASKAFDPENRMTLMLLFLRAWNALAVTALKSPPFIHMNPDLPEGVLLPSGADPELIEDKALRDQARDMAARHRLAVKRWNAGRRAQAHLTDLANLSARIIPLLFDTPEARKAFLALMKQSEGLPGSAITPLEF